MVRKLKIRSTGKQNIKSIILEGENKFATLNLVRGCKVYGERLINIEDNEYRVWDPMRSKLAAALHKGLELFPIEEGMNVLYLGVSTGTTASHLSDILGLGGVLFAVEVAPRVGREFIERVALKRTNVIPIIEDARRPNRYMSIFSKVNVVYCDIAQYDQTEIAIQNCERFLLRGGNLLLIIKARSINTLKDPEKTYKEEISKIEKNGFKINQIVRLDPFDRDHALISAIS